MQIHYVSEQNSLLTHFLSEIRDVTIQTDRLRFRKNMERIGEIMAYEISKTLAYESVSVQTPLGTKHTAQSARSGIVFHFARRIEFASRVYEFL
jgi:uracil phosphoribosyltransferase